MNISFFPSTKIYRSHIHNIINCRRCMNGPSRSLSFENCVSVDSQQILLDTFSTLYHVLFYQQKVIEKQIALNLEWITICIVRSSTNNNNNNGNVIFIVIARCNGYIYVLRVCVLKPFIWFNIHYGSFSEHICKSNTHIQNVRHNLSKLLAPFRSICFHLIAVDLFNRLQYIVCAIE